MLSALNIVDDVLKKAPKLLLTLTDLEANKDPTYRSAGMAMSAKLSLPNGQNRLKYERRSGLPESRRTGTG
jgi:hypothetical protein